MMWTSGWIGHNAMMHNNMYSMRHYEIILAFGKICLEFSVILIILTMINSWESEKSWMITRYITYVIFTFMRLVIVWFVTMSICYNEMVEYLK